MKNLRNTQASTLTKINQKFYATYWKQPMFIYAMPRFSKLSAITKRVYAVIYSNILRSEISVFLKKDAHFMSKNGQIMTFLTLKQIANSLNVSESMVSGAKKNLEKIGLIHCVESFKGFKRISKIYLTELDQLGIPAELLYQGTYGGIPVTANTDYAKAEVRNYAKYVKLPIFIGKRPEYHKYNNRGWDIYTYIYNQILNYEEQYAQVHVTSHVDENGRFYYKTRTRTELAHQLKMDVKTFRNQIKSLIADKLIEREYTADGVHYYLTDLVKLNLDKSLIYKGLLGGIRCETKGINEIPSPFIPNKPKAKCSKGLYQFTKKSVHNSKGKQAYKINVLELLTSKQGINADNINSNNLINNLDLDKKTKPFLIQIVKKLIGSNVRLNFLNLKTATTKQITVIKNQLVALSSYISQLSKNIVLNKVNYVCHYTALKIDAVNYLINCFKNELKTKKARRQITMNKQHSFNKHNFKRNFKNKKQKKFATNLDKKLYYAKDEKERQQIMDDYYKQVEAKDQANMEKYLQSLDVANADLPF